MMFFTEHEALPVTRTKLFVVSGIYFVYGTYS